MTQVQRHGYDEPNKEINKNPLETHSHSDSHVMDTKFDSDDKSSLLIKCQRAYTVSKGFLFISLFASLKVVGEREE